MPAMKVVLGSTMDHVPRQMSDTQLMASQTAGASGFVGGFFIASLSGERVHVEAAEVEEDVGLEALAVAVAA